MWAFLVFIRYGSSSAQYSEKQSTNYCSITHCGGWFCISFLFWKLDYPPRLSESDAKCYGIDVPEDIEFTRVDLFCSCMRMSNIEDTEEKSDYCAKQVGN